MQEEEQVSLMVLPDYSSGSGEKDINVLNFNLRYARPLPRLQPLRGPLA